MGPDTPGIARRLVCVRRSWSLADVRLPDRTCLSSVSAIAALIVVIAAAIGTLALPALGGAQDADAVPRESEAPEAWLVWVGDTDGDGATTFELEATASGGYRIVARERGIHVVVDGERVELVRSEVSAVAYWCDWSLDDAADGYSDSDLRLVMDPDHELRAARLEVLDRRGPRTLISEPGLDRVTDFEDELEVLATIGVYVIVRRGTWVGRGCEGHAEGWTHVRWIDIRTGSEADIVSERPPDLEVLRAAAERLERRATTSAGYHPPDTTRCTAATWPAVGRARGPDPVPLALRDYLLVPLPPELPRPGGVSCGPMSVVDAIPRWTGERWLTRHRLEYFLGSSFDTPDELTDTDEPLPERLAGDDTAPSIVRRFLRRFPRATRLGFSRLR